MGEIRPVGQISNGQISNKEIVAGIDIASEYIQISYMVMDEDKPVTLKPSGNDEYNIPMCVSKRRGANQWFLGREAKQYALDEKVPLYTNLFNMAVERSSIIVEDMEIQANELFMLFFKKCYSFLKFFTSGSELKQIVITVEKMNENMSEIFEMIINGIGIDAENIHFENRQESLFHYLLNQPEELWHYQVGVFDFTNKELKAFTFSRNLNTTPIVTLINEEKQDLINALSEFDSEELKEKYYKSLDEAFLNVLEAYIDGKILSSVYFIGQGFLGNWYKESLKFLCKGRRVFEGNNLYSKGACFSARSRLEKSDIEKKHILLSDDKLKYNIGVMVKKGGMDAYVPLLDGGVNWYEAKGEWSFIIGEGPYISICMTDLTGAKKKEIVIEFENHSIRTDYTTRISLRLSMKDSNKIYMEIIDEGFGEFFAPGGTLYIGELPINQNSDRHMPCNLRKCVGEYSKTGYHIHKVKKEIHFIEELCYYMLLNTYLLDESFMISELVAWIGEGCGLTKLASRLKKAIDSRESVSSFVTLIFREANYLSDEKMEQVIDIIKENDNLNVYQRQKHKADHLFLKENYIFAIEDYGSILEEDIDRELEGDIMHNIACCYARLFYYKIAGTWFLKAYEATGRQQEIENFLYCERMRLSKKEYIDITTDSTLYYESAVEVEKSMERAQQQWEISEEKAELHKFLELREIDKAEYYNRLNDMLNGWKKEYVDRILV